MRTDERLQSGEDSKQIRKSTLNQGPRSKIVEAIAVLLLARPMRVAEIAEILGKPPRYISSYLSYWRTRGLFDYENGYWILTPEGEEFARTILEREMNTRVSQYAVLARQILEAENVKPTMNSKTEYYSPRLSGELQSFIAGLTSKPGNKLQGRGTAHCVMAILDQLEIDDEERMILEHLLLHYIKWGTTYTYMDQIARELDADTMWLLQVTRRLQSKGLIYIYNDKRLGMRIGLSKKTKQLISVCNQT